MKKIFGIGLNKSGTTSLHEALKIIGFNSAHCFFEDRITIQDKMKENIDEGKDILFGLEKYDALLDFNNLKDVMCLVSKLYLKYPDSLFIVTKRNKDDWVKSFTKHNELIHGLDKEQSKKNKIVYEQLYDKVLTDIDDFFKDKPNLLIMDICGGDGWEKLCPFLNKKIPKISFPYFNKT
ncbi:sulfotransferase family protein [Candidatus Woesearchaeota archaeon]|nr:sulfotransferase family protein [Candidatus Woesearchaeota archaeon]